MIVPTHTHTTPAKLTPCKYSLASTAVGHLTTTSRQPTIALERSTQAKPGFLTLAGMVSRTRSRLELFLTLATVL